MPNFWKLGRYSQMQELRLQWWTNWGGGTFQISRLTEVSWWQWWQWHQIPNWNGQEKNARCGENGGLWRKLMRKGSNQQTCGSMNQLDWELYTERSVLTELNTTRQLLRGSTRICCAPQALLLCPHSQRRRVWAIVRCVTQRGVHGKRQCGRPKSNSRYRWGKSGARCFMSGWSPFLTALRETRRRLS